MQANKVGHCREGSSDKVYIASIARDPAGNGFRVVGKGGAIYKSMRTYDKGTFASLSVAEAERDKLFRSKTGKSKKPYVDIESPTYSGPLMMNGLWLADWLEPSLYAEDPGEPPDAELDDEGLEELEIEVAALIRANKKVKAVRLVREKTGCGLVEAKALVDKVQRDVKLFEALNPEEAFERVAKGGLKLRRVAQDLVKQGRRGDAVKQVSKTLGIGMAEAEEMLGKVFPESPAMKGRDWEVVCVNAAGMEDNFDEGSTYVAEPHPEDDMVYVWDRNGEKRECFSERFKEAVGI